MKFQSFSDMLNYWADKDPSRPSLIYAEREKKRIITRAELRSRVREAGESFSKSKSAVFLLGENSAETVIMLLGAISSGARVSLLDDNLPAELLGKLITNAEADLLYGDPELRDELAPFVCKPKCRTKGEVLFYTSGTTQRSKAVILTEHSLCMSAANGSALLPLSESDTLLELLPLSHVFGFVCSLLWPLSCGAAVAIGRGARFYLSDFDYFRPTAVSLVPTLLSFCLKHSLLNDELKLVLIGAGDCPETMINALKALHKRVSFGYGLTETSSGVALSVGEDPFAMDICPDFDVSIASDGEILIKSPQTIMQGYFGLPEETAAVLQNGVLYTGDLGFIDENGRLHITGRKKEILVLPDGTKIFLPEYEKAISSVLGTDDICVMLIDSAVTLAVSEGDENEIKSALRPVMEKYPRGQQISHIAVLGKKLPRTATGKIKRYEVQKLLGGLQ